MFFLLSSEQAKFVLFVLKNFLVVEEGSCYVICYFANLLIATLEIDFIFLVSN